MEMTVIQLGNVLPTKTRDNPNQGRVYHSDALSPCITNISGGGGREPMIIVLRMNGSEKRCRIRKLTPRECFRLMGVSDENASKMLAVNSNTQCYKQAGNSIVVPVLMAIFSQMHIEGVKPWNEMSEDVIYRLIDENK